MDDDFQFVAFFAAYSRKTGGFPHFKRHGADKIKRRHDAVFESVDGHRGIGGALDRVLDGVLENRIGKDGFLAVAVEFNERLVMELAFVEGLAENIGHEAFVVDKRINGIINRIELVDGLIGGRKRQKFCFAVLARLDFESGVTGRDEPPAKFEFKAFAFHPRFLDFGKGPPLGERGAGARR